MTNSITSYEKALHLADQHRAGTVRGEETRRVIDDEQRALGETGLWAYVVICLITKFPLTEKGRGEIDFSTNQV